MESQNMLPRYIDFHVCVRELLAPDKQQIQGEAFSKFPLSPKRHSLQRSSLGTHPLSRNLPSFLLKTHSSFLKLINSTIKKYFHINMAFHTEF